MIKAKNTHEEIDRRARALAQAKRIEAYLPTLEREQRLLHELEELRARRSSVSPWRTYSTKRTSEPTKRPNAPDRPDSEPGSETPQPNQQWEAVRST